MFLIYPHVGFNLACSNVSQLKVKFKFEQSPRCCFRNKGKAIPVRGPREAHRVMKHRGLHIFLENRLTDRGNVNLTSWQAALYSQEDS
jgi:hypothetical protein